MKLNVNGLEKSYDQDILLSSLIHLLGLNSDKIIVQVDGVIIKKDLFTTFILKENSSIEILAIVGGGWNEWKANNWWWKLWF